MAVVRSELSGRASMCSMAGLPQSLDIIVAATRVSAKPDSPSSDTRYPQALATERVHCAVFFHSSRPTMHELTSTLHLQPLTGGEGWSILGRKLRVRF